MAPADGASCLRGDGSELRVVGGGELQGQPCPPPSSPSPELGMRPKVLTQAMAMMPKAKRLGPSRFQSPWRSICRAMESSMAPSRYSTCG